MRFNQAEIVTNKQKNEQGNRHNNPESERADHPVGLTLVLDQKKHAAGKRNEYRHYHCEDQNLEQKCCRHTSI